MLNILNQCAYIYIYIYIKYIKCKHVNGPFVWGKFFFFLDQIWVRHGILCWTLMYLYWLYDNASFLLLQFESFGILVIRICRKWIEIKINMQKKYVYINKQILVVCLSWNKCFLGSNVFFPFFEIHLDTEMLIYLKYMCVKCVCPAAPPPTSVKRSMWGDVPPWAKHIIIIIIRQEVPPISWPTHTAKSRP